jgi:hypothetical protein
LARTIRKARIRTNGRVAIITNPHAGKHTGHAGIGKVIGGILSSPPNPTKLYDTQDLEELEQAAAEISAERPDIIAIVGGDGTLYNKMTRYLRNFIAENPGLSLEELQDQLPLIALIPAGTMNMVATAVGANRLTVPPKELAERIRQNLANNAEFDVSHCRIMRINDQYGFIYGAGLPVDILHKYYADRSVRGGKRVAQVVVQTLWQELRQRLPFRKPEGGVLQPINAVVRLEGTEQSVAPYVTQTGLLCCTIDQLGFGAKAMPGALRHDERFMLRSTTLGYLQLAQPNVLAQVWAGLPLPDTFDAYPRKVTIEYQDEPVVRTIDGELIEPAMRDEIEIGPLLKFIIG